MKKVNWGASGIKVSAVALGCMRLEALTPEEAARYLEKAVSLGIDFFDHADIYGQGRCETLFAKALAQTELKRGVAAVKEWLHNTLYEAGRVFREHKTAILTIAGAIAGAAALAAVLWAVLKKKD